MNIYVRGLIAASGLTVLLLGFWFLYGVKVAEKPGVNTLSVLDRLEKDGVPPFTLPDMAGHSYSSDSLKGQIVVLNFWATWCPPCVAEFPSMIALAEHYKGSVKLVTIAADEKKEDVERFTGALKLKSAHWVALWDPDQKIAKEFGTIKLPETYILDKDAKLVKKVVNALDWTAPPVLKYFDELLKK